MILGKISDNSFWSNGLCIDETKISVLIFLTVWNQMLISFLMIQGLTHDISNIPFDVLQNIQFVLIAAISSINLGAIFTNKK